MNKDNCRLSLWYPLLWNTDVISCNLHCHPTRAISTIKCEVKLNQVKGAQTGLLSSKTNFGKKKRKKYSKVLIGHLKLSVNGLDGPPTFEAQQQREYKYLKEDTFTINLVENGHYNA